MNISFTVEGIPGPQGSKAYKGMVKSKATGLDVPRMVESSKKVRPWRKAVMIAATQAMQVTPGWERRFDGPVILIVDFYLPRPKAAPKRARIWAKRYPDLSKIMRATEDAITQSGLWRDDARVVRASLSKRYAIDPSLTAIYRPYDMTTPGARITILSLAEAEG